MANILNLEYPISIVAADGTTQWQGFGYVHATIEHAVNGETSASIAAGQAVAWDTGGSMRVHTPDRTLANGPLKQVMKVKLATSTGDLDQFAGVALRPAVVGERVLIATTGSVVPVKTTAAGTVRQNCIRSATAGSITPQDNLDTAPRGALGKVVKIAGKTGGDTDSGSESYLICAVHIK